jgi:hypothetical protein
MAQRRSGRDDDDLSDVKALAAKARETGGPVLRQNPADLSGVRPRRDSVVGMRLTPPPRAAGGGELSNWMWGVLGCLTVLLIGFAGLFFLARTGKLGPLLGEAATLVGGPAAAPAAPPAPAPAAAPDPAAPSEPAAAVKEPVVPHAEHAARAEHEHAAHGAPAPAPEGAPPSAPAPAAEAPSAPAAAAEPAAPPPAADDTAAAKRARGSAPKGKGAKESEAPAAADDDSAGGDTAAKPARAAAPKAAAADDSDDDSSLPGQDDVEKALDALAPRMRGCFVKYQIKGTARVRLVATPAGKAESVNVTGDFEDTPTGNCVESILSEAKLPTFKGPPLKLSQSYQLR